MKILSRIYIALILLFLFAPIFVMMIFSFNGSSSTAAFSGFSFQWYDVLFHDEKAGAALLNTLKLAVLSSVIATVLGTIAAVGLSRLKRRGVRDTIQTVTNIPMMNPDIVTAVSMLMFFVFVGNALKLESNRSFATVLVAHITFNLPYVILSIMPKIRQMDKHLLEAAQDLGCTPIQTFFRVELPVILPGILSGLLMAFTLSLDDFIITLFTKGIGFETLPTYIYAQTRVRVGPDMYALSTLIFLVILVLLILSNVLQAQMDARRDPKKIAARAAKKKKKLKENQ